MALHRMTRDSECFVQSRPQTAALLPTASPDCNDSYKTSLTVYDIRHCQLTAQVIKHS